MADLEDEFRKFTSDDLRVPSEDSHESRLRGRRFRNLDLEDEAMRGPRPPLGTLGYVLLVLAIVVGIAGVLAGVAIGVHFGLPNSVIPQLALVFGSFCGLILFLGGEKALMLLRDLRMRHARRKGRE